MFKSKSLSASIRKYCILNLNMSEHNSTSENNNVTTPTRCRRNKNLDNSIRQLICQKFDSGQPTKIISDDLQINIRTVTSVLKIYKDSGRIVNNCKKSGRKRIFTNEVKTFIKEKIDQDCSRTLVQIQRDISEQKSLDVSLSTINRAIDDFEYSFKKVELIPVARNVEANVQKRYDYCRSIITKNVDDLIFLDEMGVNWSMRQRYGRSLIGTTPRKTITTLRSQNISICAGVSRRGLLNFKISERAFNTNTFLEFINELFAFFQAKTINNKIIIMDNASIHRNEAIRNLIEQNGHQLCFLPPYSPQLNPIEEVFSVWKEKIRACNCKSKAEILTCITNTHRQITEHHCLNIYSHMQEFLGRGIDRELF